MLHLALDGNRCLRRCETWCCFTQCRPSAEELRSFTIYVVVYLQALSQLIQQLVQRTIYCQSVFRPGGIRKPIRDDFLKYLSLICQDEPQLLLRIGFDDLLNFSNRLRVALADIVEGTAWDTNLSTSVDDDHAVVHELDDLQDSIDARGSGDSFHDSFITHWNTTGEDERRIYTCHM